jgi:hypothetical protein
MECSRQKVKVLIKMLLLRETQNPHPSIPKKKNINKDKKTDIAKSQNRIGTQMQATQKPK